MGCTGASSSCTGTSSTGFAQSSRPSRVCSSIGIDSWAVDYALLRGGRMVGNPYHYRDERNTAGVAATHAIVGHDELYSRNGLQLLPFNTVYQLAADRLAGSLEEGDRALMIPDLVAYWLTGQSHTERTNASTTGLLDVRTGEWDVTLLGRLGLPPDLFGELVDPGTPVGPLLGTVRADLGSPPGLGVVAVGSHDTASAVVAVPMTEAGAAYISCGTWSLVGLELDSPVLSEASRAANFTNEGGVDGRIRYLRNVMGLWLLSESIRAWQRDGAVEPLADLLARGRRGARRPDRDVRRRRPGLPGPRGHAGPDRRALHRPRPAPSRNPAPRSCEAS